MRVKLPASACLSLCLSLTGCALIGGGGPEGDRLEPINRDIYRFNKAVDTAIFKPVAKTYQKIVPSSFQTGIGRFFDNLRLIPTIANDALQLKLYDTLHDTTRFVMNTTVGLLGFFDPAEGMGIEKRSEDFGQTLRYWGYEDSTYIVLPLLGPSTVRDGVGRGVDYYAFSVWPRIDSDGLRIGLLTLDLIDRRAELLRYEKVLDTVIDEYAFVRDAYLQRREYVSHDREGPEDDEEVDLDAEWEEEFGD